MRRVAKARMPRRLLLQQEQLSRWHQYSWLVSLPLTCRLEYVFHHWLGVQSQGSLTSGQADWYGVDQYRYYMINDCWKAGLRFEWFRNEDGTRVGLNSTSNPNKPSFVGNFYSVSCGLNWTPTDILMVRPELRADWFDGTANPYNDGNDSSQFLMGVDAILTFQGNERAIREFLKTCSLYGEAGVYNAVWLSNATAYQAAFSLLPVPA